MTTINDEEFIKFMHSGSPNWVNKGFKDIKVENEFKLTKLYAPLLGDLKEPE